MLGLSWALDGQISEAQQVFATLPARDPLAQQALALQDELRLTTTPAQISAGCWHPLWRAPWSRASLCGKPLQALTAFVLNGVFLAGAAYAFHEKLEATGAILLFFEAGWYLGGLIALWMQPAMPIDSSRRHSRTICGDVCAACTDVPEVAGTGARTAADFLRGGYGDGRGS